MERQTRTSEERRKRVISLVAKQSEVMKKTAIRNEFDDKVSQQSYYLKSLIFSKSTVRLKSLYAFNHNREASCDFM